MQLPADACEFPSHRHRIHLIFLDTVQLDKKHAIYRDRHKHRQQRSQRASALDLQRHAGPVLLQGVWITSVTPRYTPYAAAPINAALIAGSRKVLTISWR